eukprot:1181059-Prorocentrum_minimum.AAC.1
MLLHFTGPPLLAPPHSSRGDQSREGRENIPAVGTRHAEVHTESAAAAAAEAVGGEQGAVVEGVCPVCQEDFPAGADVAVMPCGHP